MKQLAAMIIIIGITVMGCNCGDESPSPTQTPESEITVSPTTPNIPSPKPVTTLQPTLEPLPTPDVSPSPDTPIPSPASTLTPDPTAIAMHTPEPQIAPPSCGFTGSITVDRASVPDSTVISAWIDGEIIGSTATNESVYTLEIEGNYTNKMVSFTVGSDKASQTSLWESDATKTIDLTVSLGPPVCGFFGSVFAQGNPVPDGTPILALLNGVTVGSTTTTDSMYNMNVTGEYTGREISFKVGPSQAQGTSTWERGANKNIDLTVPEP